MAKLSRKTKPTTGLAGLCCTLPHPLPGERHIFALLSLIVSPAHQVDGKAAHCSCWNLPCHARPLPCRVCKPWCAWLTLAGVLCQVVLLMRQIVPYTWLNWAASVPDDVTYPKYILASVIGQIPHNSIDVYMGRSVIGMGDLLK